MRVEIRVFADLRWFVPDLERNGTITVPVGHPRSVKDVVESVGVPHPEVDLLMVDGRSVGFDHLVTGGERISVYPTFAVLDVGVVSRVRPAPVAPRFVADVHLGALVRRLRAAGFDTWYATDADDATLASVAVGEERILLTRDRGLLMRREVVHGYCPRADDPDVQAGEVARRYALGPAVAPFTRCIRCNGQLEPVSKADVVDRLPPRTREEHDRFTRCGSCGQVYWPGSHMGPLQAAVDRIRAAG